MKNILTVLAFVPILAFAVDTTPIKHRKLVGDDLVYKADQVDTLLQDAGKVKKIIAGQNITISPSTGEGNVTINASGGISAKHIAMFIIPLNQTTIIPSSIGYKHFELKASKNNFATEPKALYYAHSGHADEAGIMENDKIKLFINRGGQFSSLDQRSYLKITDTITAFELYATSEVIALVDASCCWSRRSSGEWLDSEDNDLMWTYVRTTDSQREYDETNEQPAWRPIMPVKWFSQLPNWADQ